MLAGICCSNNKCALTGSSTSRGYDMRRMQPSLFHRAEGKLQITLPISPGFGAFSTEVADGGQRDLKANVLETVFCLVFRTLPTAVLREDFGEDTASKTT